LLPANIAAYISNQETGQRLEGIYDPCIKGIRKLAKSQCANKDLRLYMDAILNDNITMIAVDGLMGTGKTSTIVQHICDTLSDVNLKSKPQENPSVLISKPQFLSGGEQYGFLPGDIDEKLDPTLQSFIQYFDRFHQAGYHKLRETGIVKLLPLGYIRGLDAENVMVVIDECQNTKELISVATRRAKKSKFFFLGDTSPFQIDRKGNTGENNGLTHLIDLLKGASYFQYIEMKTLDHIVRSVEVVDIIRRLFSKYGQNPQEWII